MSRISWFSLKIFDWVIWEQRDGCCWRASYLGGQNHIMCGEPTKIGTWNNSQTSSNLRCNLRTRNTFYIRLLISWGNTYEETLTFTLQRVCFKPRFMLSPSPNLARPKSDLNNCRILKGDAWWVLWYCCPCQSLFLTASGLRSGSASCIIQNQREIFIFGGEVCIRQSPIITLPMPYYFGIICFRHCF